MNPGLIFFLSGTPGSGKSSVAIALLRRFRFGLHLPVDDLRERVVSGIAHPVPAWTGETSRQFALARASAVLTARLYAGAGFAVAIDDVIEVGEVEQLQSELNGFVVHKVLLRPSLEVTLQRNASRSNKGFDTAFLDPVIQNLYQNINPEGFAQAGWLVLDSSQLSLEQTVDQIMAWAR